jgi:hypothetical protein
VPLLSKETGRCKSFHQNKPRRISRPSNEESKGCLVILDCVHTCFILSILLRASVELARAMSRGPWVAFGRVPRPRQASQRRLTRNGSQARARRPLACPSSSPRYRSTAYGLGCLLRPCDSAPSVCHVLTSGTGGDTLDRTGLAMWFFSCAVASDGQ